MKANRRIRDLRRRSNVRLFTRRGTVEAGTTRFPKPDNNVRMKIKATR